jgi:uncharacterized protein YegP (UPF0339 family)
MGTFVITKRLNGSYKYEFNSRKGKAILISEDYELRFECEEAIEALKKAVDVIFFMRFKTKKGKMYFKVIVDEKEVAVSRKYNTQFLMEKGIAEITRSLHVSEILDFSFPADVFSPAEDIFG